MDRLAKKCVIASAILHGTLVVVLLVGPAFLGSNDRLDSKDIIDFIPAEIIDGAPAGGGNPGAGSPPPAPRPTPPPQRHEEPAPPQPRQEVRTEPRPEPRREEPAPKPVQRDTKPDPASLEPATKPSRPKISLTQVTRTSERTRTAAAAERAAARQRASQINSVLNNIRSGASSSVNIGSVSDGGVGGGGPSYASFEAVLRSVYFNNWHEPTDATSEDAVVKATVTVASDGTVMSARITKSSGDPAVDRSVQRLLEDVTYIAPFPAGAKEKQRTYPLSFSLKAKRGLG